MKKLTILIMFTMLIVATIGYTKSMPDMLDIQVREMIFMRSDKELFREYRKEVYEYKEILLDKYGY